jgi:large conductance mechanosensitive channel
MLNEFKKFALRGNVIDLAVGVVIGAAFNKIVTSLVTDIITPIIELFTGGINVKDLVLPILNLKVGLFLQSVIDFLIISFSIFMVIKAINKFKRKEEKEEKVKADLVPSKEELLLAEIRDILKDQRS